MGIESKNSTFIIGYINLLMPCAMEPHNGQGEIVNGYMMGMMESISCGIYKILI